MITRITKIDDIKLLSIQFNVESWKKSVRKYVTKSKSDIATKILSVLVPFKNTSIL
ncbi:MAG: hypothetical protein OHK0040_03080 [bacterium]